MSKDYRAEFLAAMTTPENPKRDDAPPMPGVEIPKPSQLITITVAEYHFLTKAATMLETILKAEEYNPKPVVDAVRATIEEMKSLEGCF